MATNNLDTLRAFIRNQAGLTDTKPPQPGPGRVELNHAEAMQVADWLDELAAVRARQDPTRRPLLCAECGHQCAPAGPPPYPCAECGHQCAGDAPPPVHSRPI